MQFALTSILFGLLPESAYFTLLFICAKNIKAKRLMLFGLVFAANVLCGALFAFSLWYHFAFMLSMYGILWLLYRSHFIDVFLITLSCLIVVALSAICYFAISDYWMAAAVNRIAVLAVPLLLRRKIRQLYSAYLSVWDRKPGARVKSITVRNISCIILNLWLFLANLACLIAFDRWAN